MWYKEIIDNQLFVYYNGSLIFKKWLKSPMGIAYINNNPTGFYIR